MASTNQQNSSKFPFLFHAFSFSCNSSSSQTDSCFDPFFFFFSVFSFPNNQGYPFPLLILELSPRSIGKCWVIFCFAYIASKGFEILLSLILSLCYLSLYMWNCWLNWIYISASFEHFLVTYILSTLMNYI